MVRQPGARRRGDRRDLDARAAYERRSVSVEVSASKAGWTTSAPVRSASDVPLLRLPYVSAAGASLTGDLVAGTGVGVALTGPVGEPYEVSVTWAVDGKPAGSGDVLRLTNAMIGLPVTATVTMTADRVAPFTVTTPARIVGRASCGRANRCSRRRPWSDGWRVSRRPTRVTRSPRPSPGCATADPSRGDRPDVPLHRADVGKTVVARVRATGRGIDATYRWRTGQPVVFNVYTTPGEHQVNGRRWRTACEPYSTTLRCRTDIWATQAVLVNGRWAQRTGWAFNNLSYLPLDGGTWGTNPLARTGEWVDAAGRDGAPSATHPRPAPTPAAPTCRPTSRATSTAAT
ncbi:hypothetical protein G7085_14215 [Tessaracoccus sp. HDW20]|uniref:hypothetical protein n=1 Tax=Tessaracoccus coleopterorum TaxID=2714950 RepID=UPI0018D44DD0|nr:hypothetical protein [Tessaracoccus coleopterorum]NHB85382.1 hypothetical protein [Tessaracoccus coleopterorum]